MDNIFENGFDFSNHKVFFADGGECELFDVESAKRSDFTAYYVNARATKPFKSEIAAEIYVKAESRPFVAVFSYSQWWMRPEFGNDLSKIPAGTAALILDNLDGTYTYVMCGIGSEYKTSIAGTEDGFKISLYAQYPLDSIDMQLSFITATGTSVTELTEKGASEMCKFLGNGLKIREERIMPDVFEYIGWCSWDAFHIFVNHEGLVEKAREFVSKGVPISYAIIDDMWADVPNLKQVPEDMILREMVKIMHASPMKAFEGDPDKFPKGMAEAVADIKSAGIPNVGLWFPATGYWYGLVEGEEAHTMQAGNTVKNASGRIIASPEPDAARRFFDVFCKQAQDFGCSFVKIDNQGYHIQYRELAPIGKSAAAIQAGIDSAVFERFGGALINCMGMPSECMLNRPDSAIARCSNDFSPENRAWFAKNIVECSYNGLLQGRFYINDWDMFWTDDAQAEKNAVCHAISGGPVYISDKIGRTKAGVLSPLIFDDGRILRLSESAIPTEDCIIGDPREKRAAFKLRNSFEGGAAVAAFNIYNEDVPVYGTVSASDAGLDESKSYAYYEYFTGDFGYVNGDERIDISLNGNDDMRYYTFIEKTDKKPLFIGRIDKYNPRLAVVSQSENEVRLYEGGEFAFLSDEDYAVYDEEGNEVECDRYGIIVTGSVPRENKVLRFEQI